MQTQMSEPSSTFVITFKRLITNGLWDEICYRLHFDLNAKVHIYYGNITYHWIKVNKKIYSQRTQRTFVRQLLITRHRNKIITNIVAKMKSIASVVAVSHVTDETVHVSD